MVFKAVRFEEPGMFRLERQWGEDSCVQVFEEQFCKRKTETCMSSKVYVSQQRTIESQYKAKSYRVARVCQ